MKIRIAAASLFGYRLNNTDGSAPVPVAQRSSNYIISVTANMSFTRPLLLMIGLDSFSYSPMGSSHLSLG